MVREWKGTDVLRAGLGSSFNVLDRLQGDSRISVGAVQSGSSTLPDTFREWPVASVR